MGIASIAIRPPSSEDELRERAAWLAGRSIGELAAALGVPAPPLGVRGKGKVGGLIERALGASSGSAARPDFPALGVELKTIPVDPARRPARIDVRVHHLARRRRARGVGDLGRAGQARPCAVRPDRRRRRTLPTGAWARRFSGARRGGKRASCEPTSKTRWVSSVRAASKLLTARAGSLAPSSTEGGDGERAHDLVRLRRVNGSRPFLAASTCARPSRARCCEIPRPSRRDVHMLRIHKSQPTASTMAINA